MMKDKLIIKLAAVLAMTLFAGSALAAGFNSMQEKKLGQGTVQVYDFGALKLHAYQTGDPMHDASFLLETTKNLVAMESPAFDADIAEWKSYVGSLGKPLTDILLSYHPTGGKWYGNAKSHATAKAKQAMTAGATKELVANLSQTFGAGFNTQIPAIDSLLKAGANTVGGIDVKIIEAGDGYDIALPAIKVIYTHMLGADTHSILAGQEHIKAVLASLESMKANSYVLILSSHHTPETLADVDTKIAYIKAVQTLAAQSSDRDDFVARVKKAFPDYAGLNYLDMTAGFMFAKEAN